MRALRALVVVCAASLPACEPGAPDVRAAVAPSNPAPAAGSLRFTFLSGGVAQGTSVVTIRPDGVHEATFEHGAGKQVTRYQVAPDWTFRWLDVGGAERFEVSGGRFSWRSAVEEGSAPAAAPAMYVTEQGAPELFAALARALLAADGHELPLVPAGKARIVRGERFAVPGRGGVVDATRYEIEGLRFHAFPIWLDDALQLFALSDGRHAVVREGFEAAMPTLDATQRDADHARLRALAVKLGRSRDDGFAIVDARLFDPERKMVVLGATIIVQGRRIVAAGPPSSVGGHIVAETIDARGATVVPGLWDMCSHLSPLDGMIDLASGITSARDLGSEMEQALAAKEAWDRGIEIGPRLVVAGMIDGRGGHVPQGMGAEQAVRAGFDDIQHLEMVLLGLFAKKGDETRTEAGRFTPVAEGMASLDLASPPVQALASLLAERRTVVGPTLASFERVWSGRLAPGYADLGRCLPALVRRDVLFGDLAIPAGKEATYRASFAAMQRFVKQLWDLRVPIVAGSDTLPGVGLQRELELYEAAGIPAADVLAMATIGAARVAHQERVLGAIAPGKVADLVLVAGHPDEHIRDLRDPLLVLKAGVAYVPAELRRASGVSCAGEAPSTGR